MGQIRCDGLLLQGYDSGRQLNWGKQGLPAPADDAAAGSPGRDGHGGLGALLGLQVLQLFRLHGDLRSVTKITDFYSARHRHAHRYIAAAGP